MNLELFREEGLKELLTVTVCYPEGEGRIEGRCGGEGGEGGIEERGGGEGEGGGEGVWRGRVEGREY